MTNDGGFGQQVTGGDTTGSTLVVVNNAAELRAALTRIGSSQAATVIALQGVATDYDFKANNGVQEVSSSTSGGVALASPRTTSCTSTTTCSSAGA
jgi:hypothetical protein